jgi:magnesium-protoporphyrin O-methyltransferase
MADCCTDAYGDVFGAKAARRAARRYRTKGLVRTMQTMLRFLETRGVAGLSVLEIGGGIGAIQIELLRRGAGKAVNVELSPEWEDEARSLLGETEFEGRAERRVADAVVDAATIEPADIVLLERVVCCYPDPKALVGMAAERARSVLVMSFPRDRWLNRLVVRVSNLVCRARRIAFRSYVHAEPLIETAAASRGLRLAFDDRGTIWRIVAFERPDPPTNAIA